MRGDIITSETYFYNHDSFKFSGSDYGNGVADFDFYADERGGYFYVFADEGWGPKGQGFQSTLILALMGLVPALGPTDAVPASARHPQGVPLRRWRFATRWAPRTAALGLMGLVGIAVAWFAWNRSRSLSELSQRQLTANSVESPVSSAAISPDGKYLAFADTFGLHLKLMASGEERDIPQPDEFSHGGASWWIGGWFPDATKFLATASPQFAFFGGEKSVWVVSVLGGRPHKLREDAWAWSVSPDGSQIAFTTSPHPRGSRLGDQELWLMQASGDEPRKLFATAEDSGISGVQWSPDGQRLAYWKDRQAPDKIEFSIESRGLNSDPATVILSERPEPSRLYSLSLLQDFCWLSSGRILYSLDEPGRNERISNLWEIRVDAHTGKPTGEPRKVTHWPDFLIGNLCVTADGKRLTFSKSSTQISTLVAEFEPNSRRLKPPRRLTFSEVRDWPNDWTADSKAILLNSDRNGSFGIFKQALDQNSAEPVVTGLEEEIDARLSPDGSWILYALFPRGTHPTTSRLLPIRLMRVPVLGGPTQPVLEARGYTLHSCAIRPGTACAVAEQSPDQKQYIFTAFDPVRGRGQELARIATVSMGMWNLSPDGSLLAVPILKEREHVIRIFTFPGGAVRDLIVKGWGELGAVVYWLPDGRALTVGGHSAQGCALLSVDLEGHAQPQWQERMSVYCYGIPSRDGQHLAISNAVFNKQYLDA